jgi:hypothetical protein
MIFVYPVRGEFAAVSRSWHQFGVPTIIILSGSIARIGVQYPGNLQVVWMLVMLPGVLLSPGLRII